VGDGPASGELPHEELMEEHVRDHNPRRANEQGVSLVEALVALVVMSVGMLGIASLYVASLKANRTALVRTQAVLLVNDMADRIRANPRGRSAYALSGYANGPQAGRCAGDPQANCNAQQLAQDDLARWIAAVRATLPGNPAADVQYVAAAIAGFPDRYRIEVRWSEPRDSTASQAQQLPVFRYQNNLELIAVSP
jgi:type IV pilus assembly protein PilV